MEGRDSRRSHSRELMSSRRQERNDRERNFQMEQDQRQQRGYDQPQDRNTSHNQNESTERELKRSMHDGRQSSSIQGKDGRQGSPPSRDGMDRQKDEAEYDRREGASRAADQASRGGIRTQQLIVTVKEARNLSDTDTMSKSDPYCVVSLGGRSQKTAVKNNDLNPRWNETFGFEASEDDKLFIELFDDDSDSMAGAKDKELGHVEVLVSDIIRSRGLIEKEYHVGNKKGTLLLKMEVYDEPSSQSGHSNSRDSHNQVPGAPPTEDVLDQAIVLTQDQQMSAKQFFAELDLDGSGKLCDHELDLIAEWVQDNLGEQAAVTNDMYREGQKILKKLDRDKDGRVSYEEFEAYYNQRVRYFSKVHSDHHVSFGTVLAHGRSHAQGAAHGSSEAVSSSGSQESTEQELKRSMHDGRQRSTGHSSSIQGKDGR